MGRILAPSKNQPENDLVYTPTNLALEIINHFNPSGKILDPAKGNGAFYDQFPTGSIKYYCELSEGKNFFDFNEQVDWIITNPPWSKMRQFITKGTTVSNDIVYLASITHFMTKARLRDLQENGFYIKEIYGVNTPSKPWPSSGFQLAAVHLSRMNDTTSTFPAITMTGNFG